MLPDNQVFVRKVLLESSIDLPAVDIEDVRIVLLILLQMPSNVLHALVPAGRATELAIAAENRTDAVLGSLAKLQVAACLMVRDVILIHWVLFHVASSRALRGVHAAEVLSEEIFAVEVVVVAGAIVRVGGGCAEIASPEA